ncbi:TetR/AcrR family transcriptional regulator [Halomarina ordinaria]|uniref:TetR/AcrR family transcriptional regulator n=1 Tax=Halomarina ordinaria TaxID=3033939 RepID=A0ABD5U3G2_9EURY|nr:TetR/AcrR family transcriptional regulator [Halomarina sp. PSRA2]
MTDETIDEIMSATYCALCKHGYASLRMQDIADESTKSKATLHYYYDSKHDLLCSFLEYLYESFDEAIEEPTGDDPAEELVALVEFMLTPRDEDTHQEFQTAILEIKAQGPYDETFREHLTRFDRRIHDRFEAVVEAGVERGVFRSDVDPDATADFFVTVINGARSRYVAVEYPFENTRRSLLGYVESSLLADGAGVVVE